MYCYRLKPVYHYIDEFFPTERVTLCFGDATKFAKQRLIHYQISLGFGSFTWHNIFLLIFMSIKIKDMPITARSEDDLQIALLKRKVIEEEKRLLNHPLYENLNTIENIKVFMKNHIFAVWDFLILAKRVQRIVSPTSNFWKPNQDPKLRRFINEIMISEESDDLGDGIFMSHCDMYIKAMREINASTDDFFKFQNKLTAKNFQSYLDFEKSIPLPAYEFLRVTHAHINSRQPHITIASFAYGREHLVPLMFTEMLRHHMDLPKSAPMFYQYLLRHIDVDSNTHGPLSQELLNHAINNDIVRHAEVEAVKLETLMTRHFFYDKILEEINPQNM